MKDDINLGLEHYHGQFDLVQARMVALGQNESQMLNPHKLIEYAGIRDYKETLDQMWKTVRPMGLLLLQDPDFHLYDDYGIPMEVEDLTSSRHRWLATYINCFGVAERRLCRDIQAFTQFQSWLGQYPDLEDLGYDDCWMPIGLQYPSPGMQAFSTTDLLRWTQVELD